MWTSPPELSPVENTWQHLRHNWLSNRGYDELSLTLQKVMATLADVGVVSADRINLYLRPRNRDLPAQSIFASHRLDFNALDFCLNEQIGSFRTPPGETIEQRGNGQKENA